MIISQYSWSHDILLHKPLFWYQVKQHLVAHGHMLDILVILYFSDICNVAFIVAQPGSTCFGSEICHYLASKMFLANYFVSQHHMPPKQCFLVYLVHNIKLYKFTLILRTYISYHWNYIFAFFVYHDNVKFSLTMTTVPR